MLVAAAVPSAHSAAPRREALRRVSGEVVRIETLERDQQPAMRVVVLRGEDGTEIPMLVGPATALDELGLRFEPGDRVRARVFAGGDPPWPVHKIRNDSRGQMARLRTLTRMPLWDGAGHWVGTWGGRGGMGPGPHREHGGSMRHGR
ncbi:MAG: hypothetical protein D6738_02515 [Acidobacteria bacterium]|nr:MAG: hypothetical protein D6738_02515 [Acidobacteriota bacterium]